jgi:hypothetical protein
MPYRDTFSPGRGPPGGHLRVLGRDLEGLSAQLCDDVARAVGRAAAGAVQDVVRTAFARLAPGLPATPAPSRQPWGEPPSWGGGHRDWRHDGDDGWRGGWHADDGDDEQDRWADDDEPERYGPTARDERPARIEAPASDRVSPAVVAGCQAAAWWLGRHRGQGRLLAAFAVGLATAVALTVAPSNAVPALTLLSLAQAAGDAGVALNGDRRP